MGESDLKAAGKKCDKLNTVLTGAHWGGLSPAVNFMKDDEVYLIYNGLEMYSDKSISRLL